ncbi:EAL domain-containing protein [Magnetospirillum sp. 15-1]|uniref:EAL domain-containing protein n=1 Tax=Magnetospirillum sp. 15-1 TaxID=1979370 RepID=UPI000BBB7D06|nr:EAL domain-containing protein [Magnetospirillum sp. 15-1]
MTFVRHKDGSGIKVEQLVAHFEGKGGGSSLLKRCVHFEDCGAVGRHGELRLRSAFQPLFLAATMAAVAHEALLRVHDVKMRAVSPEQAFKIPKTPEQIVHFDRLCRTIHAINFVTQAQPDAVLYLNVDGRHLLNVHNGTHGSFFETLLGYCGLRPTQVVLEILESRIGDLDRLVEAIAAYQRRGFRVAIDDFGCRHSNFDRLWRLSPDIVKLDRSLIVQSTVNPRARQILPKLVDIIHDLGARVVCEGIETVGQHALAVNSGVDMLQGYLYAKPAPHLQYRPQSQMAAS